MVAERVGRNVLRAVTKGLGEHLVDEHVGFIDAVAKLLGFDAQFRT